VQIAHHDWSESTLAAGRVEAVDGACIELLQFDGPKFGQDMGADYGLVLR
jgi:tetrahydromethanopterin S-methyltransferase subunit G